MGAPKTGSNAQQRNSSVELLKVIGIVLIVISHVLQTLHNSIELSGVQDYVLDLSAATTNVQYLLLAMLRYGGIVGNTIFFVCSAWFLLDSKSASKKKILQLLLDIWVVSMVILGIVYLLRGGAIDSKLLVRQFLPTAFHNNWYMTCYLLFYPMHPYLNRLIGQLSQKALLRASLVLSVLYLGINFLNFFGDFFASQLILWVTIYFVIAYMKYYLPGLSGSVKCSLVLFGIGFLGTYGLILLTNFLGLHISRFQNDLLRWNVNWNPFVIIMAIGLLNLARSIHFESRTVNRIAKLSMLIYIIHENTLLGLYYRPLMWQWVYLHPGYQFILLWAFVLAAIVFAFALIAGFLYQSTLQKCTAKAVNRLYPLLQKSYGKLESWLLAQH